MPSNEVRSWAYDAAGNRSGSGYTYDNLNMMGSSPWATYDNDKLGFRKSETSGSNTTTYTWDVLQRMTGRTGSTEATYEYRADGMRSKKTVGTSVSGYTSTLTRHDAQMPFEIETLKPDGTVSATREVLGARGVDAEETVAGTWSGSTRTLGTSTIAYPIYDGHGNRVCTLSRYGSGSWTTDSPRFVDAWGTMRTGSATGASPMRYCASLGHLHDDESGLVYMRARYYEPGSGRFLSEDPSLSGQNWYVYADNSPTTKIDRSGCDALAGFIQFLIGVIEMWIGGQLVGMSMEANSLLRLEKYVTDKMVKDFAKRGQMLLSDIDELQRTWGKEIARRQQWERGQKGFAGITALVGYSLIIDALIRDIDLATEGSGFDVLSFMFGGN